MKLYTIRLLQTILLCAFAFLSARAHPAGKQEDSIKEYYQRCMLRLDSPEVLAMCDTLTARAQQAGDGHFIVLAEMTRLDYYYFKNDKDKVLEYVDRVKQLTRQYNETEYYYFTWGSRLITFYLKNGMTNHALFEAQNMLREAQAEDSPKSLIECYKAMANTYSVQSIPKLAAEYFRKMIALVEKYDSEDINLPIYYSSLAENEMSAGAYDRAGKTLDQIEHYFEKADTVTPYQQLSLLRSRLQLSIHKKDRTETENIHRRIENLFAQNPDLSIHATALYETQMDYLMASEQYGKMLAIIDSVWKTRPSVEMRISLLSKKGEILWKMNDKATAAECYRDYITLTDSVRQSTAQNSANEVAGLLNLQQLEKEKQQLLVDIQQRRLKTTYWAIALLGLALAAGTVVVIRLFRLNHRLKEAEGAMLRQNDDLKRAKEKAEEASVMKSRFIQDISHEVRTPLNAIVGFSQVVCEMCDNPETEEYTSLIETNSDHLLRLFDNVLTLSDLDQLDKLPYDTLTGVNDSCRKAADKAKSYIGKGVEFSFRPSEENIQVLSNPVYVLRVLDGLLHNAARFTESGHIAFECSVLRAEGIIRYSVSDSGPGIPPENKDIIFERFKKLDSFTQGSGLGLSVCRAIAVKLNGTLELDTDYTPGCRFVLCLPLVLPDKVS